MDFLSNAALSHLHTAKFNNCIPRPFAAATISSLDIKFGCFAFEFDLWDFAPFVTSLEHTGIRPWSVDYMIIRVFDELFSSVSVWDEDPF